MEPLRSDSSLYFETAELANSLASIIETTMEVYTHSMYSFDTLIQRWTEDNWYCYIKPKYYSPDTLLFSVHLGRMSTYATLETKGFFLQADFQDTDRTGKFLPPDQKIQDFIQSLHQLTRLPVNCYKGETQLTGGGW